MGQLPEIVRSRIRANEDGCWEWLGSIEAAGYGLLSLPQSICRPGEGRTERVHRFVYRRLVGPIGTGHDIHIDHLCRNRRCCNPAHLEVVDARTNVLRGVGPAAQRAAKTRCKHGHDLTDDANVIIRIRNGHLNRRCRRCRQVESVKQAAAAKAARQAARVS